MRLGYSSMIHYQSVVLLIWIWLSNVQSFHHSSIRRLSQPYFNDNQRKVSPTEVYFNPQSYQESHSLKIPPYGAFPTNLQATEDLAVKDVDGKYQEDIKKSLQWVGASLGFSLLLGVLKGQTSAVEFAAGYVLEQSLSVDNLFVFLVLFDYFNVPKDKQERVLKYGLAVAVVLRGIFIGLGSVAIEKYHSVLLVFAAILFFSSYKILFSGDDDGEEDMSQNAIVKFATKFFKTTDKYDGDRFFTMENGEKLATPLFLCLLCVEFSDVIFALDSVPAVFGVTSDPLVVFTSNIFAIASLRSVYGVLSRAVEQLEYLEKAVGVVLAIIALKMGAEVMGVTLLSPLQSLLVVLATLGTGVVASLVKNNDDAKSAN